MTEHDVLVGYRLRLLTLADELASSRSSSAPVCARRGPVTQLLLEPMGGAISCVGEHETALRRRDAEWCFHAIALWMDPGHDAAAAHVA